MKTRIITVALREDVDKRLRELAILTYGKRKGYLSRALTEAVELWAREKEEKDSVVKTMELLKKGINMGGIKYKSRDELHER